MSRRNGDKNITQHGDTYTYTYTYTYTHTHTQALQQHVHVTFLPKAMSSAHPVKNRRENRILAREDGLIRS
eukprot:6230480-Pyramimonas_sp.AAC.1